MHNEDQISQVKNRAEFLTNHYKLTVTWQYSTKMNAYFLYVHDTVLVEVFRPKIEEVCSEY